MFTSTDTNNLLLVNIFFFFFEFLTYGGRGLEWQISAKRDEKFAYIWILTTVQCEIVECNDRDFDNSWVWKSRFR